MTKRSDEIRAEIAKRVKELEDMRMLAEKEQRSPVAEELEKANKLMDEVQTFEVELQSAETEERMAYVLDSAKRSQRPPQRPELDAARDPRRSFRNFGEMLHAVVKAGSPGGILDPRLERAASGMSESVPGDGGLA